MNFDFSEMFTIIFVWWFARSIQAAFGFAMRWFDTSQVQGVVNSDRPELISLAMNSSVPWLRLFQPKKKLLSNLIEWNLPLHSIYVINCFFDSFQYSRCIKKRLYRKIFPWKKCAPFVARSFCGNREIKKKSNAP